MNFKLSFLFTLCTLSLGPANAEHIGGTSWDHYGYHQGYGQKCTAPFDKEEEYQNRDWFLKYKELLLSSSTTEEKDLEHKRVAYSFTPSGKGEIQDLKIEQSSGSAAIDKKAEAIIRRANLRKMSPPSNRTPFTRGLLVKFDDEPFLSIRLCARSN